MRRRGHAIPFVGYSNVLYWQTVCLDLGNARHEPDLNLQSPNASPSLIFTPSATIILGHEPAPLKCAMDAKTSSSRRVEGCVLWFFLGGGGLNTGAR